MTKQILLRLLFLVAIAAPAAAVEPNEVLEDPALEARARELSAVIRCLVCQNESIDSSNADLARDLRVLVRERLVAGDSNDEVLDFLVARYGDFVLLNPPFKPKTYLLWFGPALILLLGLVLVAVYLKRGRTPAGAPQSAPLSEAERKRVEALLDEDARP